MSSVGPRKVFRASGFKKDWKRATAGKSAKVVAILSDRFAEVATLLVHDEPIPERWRDHALTGDWVGHRDLHVRPDLVLIYAKSETPDGLASSPSSASVLIPN